MSVNEWRRRLDQLSRIETHNLLLNALMKINQVKVSNNDPEELQRLYDWVEKSFSLDRHQRIFDQDYDAAHLIIGESPAGALKVGLGRHHLIIGFPDSFEMGPLWHLYQEEGIQYRFEWMKKHINMTFQTHDHIEDDYTYHYLYTLEKIKAIPEHLPIVIWTADNASEQIGLLYLLTLLKQKNNPVSVVHATELYKKDIDRSSQKIHTTDLHPNELHHIYVNGQPQTLTQDEKNSLYEKWETLDASKAVLRIWEDNEIKCVAEDSLDDLLVSTLDTDQESKDADGFMLAVRLVGSVLIQHLNRTVNPFFLEYRIRTLIYNGVFQIKGVPKSMNAYRIKMRKNQI